MSGSGPEALPDVREWLRDPTGFALVVGRLFRMSRTDSETLPNVRDALSDVWQWSGDPPGSPRVARRPSRMSGSGRHSFPDV